MFFHQMIIFTSCLVKRAAVYQISGCHWEALIQDPNQMYGSVRYLLVVWPRLPLCGSGSPSLILTYVLAITVDRYWFVYSEKKPLKRHWTAWLYQLLKKKRRKNWSFSKKAFEKKQRLVVNWCASSIFDRQYCGAGGAENIWVLEPEPKLSFK